MRTVREIARSVQDRRRIQRTKLPWHELEAEAEAERQGCSPADIFFDRAGHKRDRPAADLVSRAR